MNFDITLNDTLVFLEQFLSIGGYYIVLCFFIERIINISLNRLSVKNQFIATEFLPTVKKLVRFIIVVICIYLIVSKNNIFNFFMLEENFKRFKDVFFLCSFFCVIFYFTKTFKTKLLEAIDEEKVKMDKTFVQIMYNFINTILVCFFIIFFLQRVGVSVSGILAVGGISALVTGLSAKELLSNLFGGAALLLDKPFRVGDWIKSPDKSIEGVVEEIGLNRTLIRTFEKKALYVPNSLFTTICIENASKIKYRSLHIKIGLKYSEIESIKKISEEIEDLLKNHPLVNKKMPIFVSFDEFENEKFNLSAYAFTDKVQWTQFKKAKHDLIINAFEIAKKYKVEITQGDKDSNKNEDLYGLERK